MRKYDAFNFETDVEKALRLYGSPESSLLAQLSNLEYYIVRARCGYLGAFDKMLNIIHLTSELKAKTSSKKYQDYCQGGQPTLESE